MYTYTYTYSDGMARARLLSEASEDPARVLAERKGGFDIPAITEWYSMLLYYIICYYPLLYYIIVYWGAVSARSIL